MDKVLVPGTAAEGITLDIYNASKQPGDAKVSKHMILFQPSGLTQHGGGKTRCGPSRNGNSSARARAPRHPVALSRQLC